VALNNSVRGARALRTAVDLRFTAGVQIERIFSVLVVQRGMNYFRGMKREEIIRDIHGLDTELAALEEQYGLLST
jgi:hypothetical protein